MRGPLSGWHRHSQPHKTRHHTVDVAVGNPAAASYINPTSGYRPPAAHNADPIGRNYAIEHREEEKLLRYRTLLAAADPTTFVSFAMTTTGCTSNSATRFLRDEVLRDSNSTSSCSKSGTIYIHTLLKRACGMDLKNFQLSTPNETLLSYDYSEKSQLSAVSSSCHLLLYKHLFRVSETEIQPELG